MQILEGVEWRISQPDCNGPKQQSVDIVPEMHLIVFRSRLIYNHIDMNQYLLKRPITSCTGCKKRTFRMLLEPQWTGSITSSRLFLCLKIDFFGRFLLRLSLIKPSLAMSIVKFIHRAFNFGYDFVLLVHFFWDRL